MVDRNPSNGSQETKLLAQPLLLLKEYWVMIMEVVLLVCVLVLLRGMEKIVAIKGVSIMEDIAEMIGVRL